MFTVNYIFISTSIIFINLQIKALSANFSLASFIYTFGHLRKLDKQENMFFLYMHAHTHNLSAFSFPWISTRSISLSLLHTALTLFQSIIYAFKHVFFFSHTHEHIHLTVNTKQENKQKTCSLTHTHTHTHTSSLHKHIHVHT